MASRCAIAWGASLRILRICNKLITSLILARDDICRFERSYCLFYSSRKAWTNGMFVELQAEERRTFW